MRDERYYATATSALVDLRDTHAWHPSGFDLGLTEGSIRPTFRCATRYLLSQRSFSPGRYSVNLEGDGLPRAVLQILARQSSPDMSPGRSTSCRCSRPDVRSTTRRLTATDPLKIQARRGTSTPKPHRRCLGISWFRWPGSPQTSPHCSNVAWTRRNCTQTSERSSAGSMGSWTASTGAQQIRNTQHEPPRPPRVSYPTHS